MHIYVVFSHRVEHGSFTQQEVTAFNQLVRVLVRDFLPFLKRIFTGLFSETAVEQLALSTPYALRHSRKGPPTTDSVQFIRTSRPGVELQIELNMDSIAEPLRQVASGVFEEMENLKQQEFAVATELQVNSDGSIAGPSKEERVGERGVVEEEDEIGRGGEEEQWLSNTKSLQDGVKVEQRLPEANHDDRGEFGAHLDDDDRSKSQESSQNTTSTGSGNSQLLLAGHGVAVTQDLELETKMTNVLHNTSLAKDKAA